MKRYLLILPVLFLLAFTACKEEDVYFLADTLSIAVDAGLPVWNGAHQEACSSGRATPEQCSNWDTLYPKLLTTWDAMKFTYEEVKKTKGKAAMEKLKILVADLKVIVSNITNLVNAWKKK